MKTSNIFITGLASLLILGCAGNVAAAGRTFLGERNVSDSAEYDVFRVGPGQGAFNALQVRAEGAPVEIRLIRIYFTNGTTQTIERNILLGRNSWTGVANLNGHIAREQICAEDHLINVVNLMAKTSSVQTATRKPELTKDEPS